MAKELHRQNQKLVQKTLEEVNMIPPGSHTSLPELPWEALSDSSRAILINNVERLVEVQMRGMFKDKIAPDQLSSYRIGGR